MEIKKIQSKYFIEDSITPFGYKDGIWRRLCACRAFLYKIRMSANRVETVEKEYKVSVCAIFKNEAPYLREWIEFNHIVGVEHFYLYNNNSDDDYYNILKPYIDSGLVTLNQWPRNQAQMECYEDCIKKYRATSNWLGFIDIDEFIVPKSKNTIYEILKPFETKRGSVKVYWKMFGTGGMLKRDLDTLVTESFTVCWPKYYSVGKCFYNTSFDFNPGSKKNIGLHHEFWTSHNGKEMPPVNVFDKVCTGKVNPVGKSEHSIQINHYFSKSYDEYLQKCAKGDVFFEMNPHDEEYFYLHEMENTSVDYSAYKYLAKLKLALDGKYKISSCP